MAIPMIAMAARGLLSKLAKRYAGKALSTAEKRDLRAATIKKLRKKGKPVTEEAVLKGTRRRAKAQGAMNALGDASGAALVGETVSQGIKLDDIENQKKLLQHIKENYPKLYKQFRDSDFTNIKDFLKNKGVKFE